MLCGSPSSNCFTRFLAGRSRYEGILRGRCLARVEHIGLWHRFLQFILQRSIALLLQALLLLNLAVPLDCLLEQCLIVLHFRYIVVLPELDALNQPVIGIIELCFIKLMKTLRLELLLALLDNVRKNHLSLFDLHLEKVLLVWYMEAVTCISLPLVIVEESFAEARCVECCLYLSLLLFFFVTRFRS